MIVSTRTTPPSVPLWTSDEAITRLHLSVDSEEDNELIDFYIQSATDHVEGPRGTLLGRALINQTWTVTGESFDEFYRLPIAPVSTVVISYIDENGDTIVLPDDSYILREDHIILKSGQTWPATNGISMVLTAGYGPASTDVPSSIRHAILLLVGHWYANREAVSNPGFATVPIGAEHLLSLHRRMYL